MKYDFDSEIERYNTASVKWDEAAKLFGREGILPMWVADMDFMSPASVVDAIERRARHGVYGYSVRPDSYYEAVISWMERRYGWRIEREWISHSPGVLAGLSLIVRSFTRPGDKVVIQPPVYHPFSSIITHNGRQVAYNPLKLVDGRYTMDFGDLQKKLDDSVKLLILCNPHNPVGRVWMKDELVELGSLCLKNNIILISDEIHADLRYRGYVHTPFASISEQFAQNTIVCTAASKTFNLAGLQTSNLIIPNEEIRGVYQQALKQAHLSEPNIFGVVATESAYRYGEGWLEQLIDYLQNNLDLLKNFLRNHDGITVVNPEGTYLVWLDCRNLGMDAESLQYFWRKEAGLALNDGAMFGPGGEGFVRMNIACPRSVLNEALSRIDRALGGRRGDGSLHPPGRETLPAVETL